MPEGDSVRREAMRLEASLSGAELTVAELRWGSLAEVTLVGRHVLESVSVGKHLLTRLAATPGSPALTLHTHLRMDGRWRIWPCDDRALPGPRTTVRVLLGTEKWLAAGFSLGRVDLLPTSQEHRVVGHLGPDVLGQSWDEVVALERLRRSANRTVGQALLDQRNLAGLGTYWVSEALYLQGISPSTTVADAVGLPRLVQRLPELLSCSRRPPARVYGLRGRPCPRCGATIRSVTVGQPPTARELQFCPRCQPA